MARVFISYARKNLATAEPLRDALIEAGFDAYLDIHDIAPGEPWQDRLGALIAGAEKIVFLISPHSVASEICAWEVDHAERLGKSILPVVISETEAEAIPGRLSRLNFIFHRESDDTAKARAALVEALSVDLDWEREKTRINDLALDWDGKDRPRHLLPWRENRVREMEAWRDTHPETSPPPTELQLAFITESRRAATRRQRMIVSGSIAGTIVAAGLALFAFLQSQEAIAQRDRAEQNFSTAERAINSLIFDIAQDLKNIEGVSPAAIQRILGQSRDALETLLATDPDNPRLAADERGGAYGVR